MKFIQWLYRNDACEEAMFFVGNKTLQEAWAQCKDARWMIWLLIAKENDKGWLTTQKRRNLSDTMRKEYSKYLKPYKFSDPKIIAKKRKELYSIHADYIRTQFTPPEGEL
jgi:hypothetical protein